MKYETADFILDVMENFPYPSMSMPCLMEHAMALGFKTNLISLYNAIDFLEHYGVIRVIRSPGIAKYISHYEMLIQRGENL